MIESAQVTLPLSSDGRTMDRIKEVKKGHPIKIHLLPKAIREGKV